jgi:hypothetical protein
LKVAVSAPRVQNIRALRHYIFLSAKVDEAQKHWEWVRQVAKTETCAQATKYRVR